MVLEYNKNEIIYQNLKKAMSLNTIELFKSYVQFYKLIKYL